MDRKTAMRRAGAVVLAANVALVVAKGGVWWYTGSLAIGSEAVNSGSDALYSLVVLGGLYLTTRPADFEHPHGHERIEPFVSLFVAVGVFAAGITVLYNATTAVLTGTYGGAAGALGVAVLLASAGAKYGLYRYCRRVGETHNSPALVAAALDNRNDILTAAAALVGVVGAAAGYPVLDPIAAGVVSLGILYTGYEIVRDNVNYLSGPPRQRTCAARSSSARCATIGSRAPRLVAHYVGPEVDVSLHIEVEGDLSLFEAHDIESAVVQDIRSMPEVDDVFVHVDPKEMGEWKADRDADRLLGR
ncbi:cation diffusion facilitator family transporter [Halarchaeum acidiphilum]|uniref:cation diffusion facilitator family transporter n=1 Tax=Halarchaeum acidiphilum TaxID=489138 RepID=UPI000B163E54|nr:cation diffusion facilitator family transporter [Halarchaeum acidiphilum]